MTKKRPLPVMVYLLMDFYLNLRDFSGAQFSQEGFIKSVQERFFFCFFLPKFNPFFLSDTKRPRKLFKCNAHTFNQGKGQLERQLLTLYFKA